MIFYKKKRVLIPTDFSAQAKQAVLMALDMTDDPSDIRVIHVAPPVPSYPAIDPAVVWETIADEAREDKIRDWFRQEVADPRADALHLYVAIGSPAEEIIDYAEKAGVDLIMLPSHGRSGIKRLLLGSVTERVVRMAHCHVLVLRS